MEKLSSRSFFTAISLLFCAMLLSQPVHAATSCTTYTGALLVHVTDSGCTGSENVCGLGGTGADFCDYYAFQSDHTNPLYMMYSYCPAISNVTTAYLPIRSCWAKSGQPESFYSILCTKDYLGIESQSFKWVSCSDANCTNYKNIDPNNVIRNIVQNTFANGTVIDSICSPTGTKFNYTTCLNGNFVNVSASCGSGCNYVSGCNPLPNQLCAPNEILNGTCSGNIATQLICSNDGYSNKTQSAYCGQNQYCSKGKCINIPVQIPPQATCDPTVESWQCSNNILYSCSFGQWITYDNCNLYSSHRTCSIVGGNGVCQTVQNTVTPTPNATSPNITVTGNYIFGSTTTNVNWINVGGACGIGPSQLSYKYCPAGAVCYVTCQSENYPDHSQSWLYNDSNCMTSNILSSSPYYMPAQCWENSTLNPSICIEYSGYLHVHHTGMGCNSPNNYCALGTVADICEYWAIDGQGNAIGGNYCTLNSTLFSSLQLHQSCSLLWPNCPYGYACQVVSGQGIIPTMQCVPTGKVPTTICETYPGMAEYIDALTGRMQCGKDYFGIVSDAYKKINCLDANCSAAENNIVNINPLDLIDMHSANVSVGSRMSGHCYFNTILNEAWYDYSVCKSDGSIGSVSEYCNYGCSDSLGCYTPYTYNCTPNLVVNYLHGACLDNKTMSADKCDELGESTYKVNITCPKYTSCVNGTCWNCANLNNCNFINNLPASTNPVIVSIFSPTGLFLIVFTAAMVLTWILLEEENIVKIEFIIGNFMLGLTNYFVFGYLCAFFGALVLFYSMKERMPKGEPE